MATLTPGAEVHPKPRGWHAHPEIDWTGKVGWLAQPERLDRRNRNDTLTARNIATLLRDIGSKVPYSNLLPAQDQILRMRDAAVLCLWWIFFKRGGELLSVLARNVITAEGKLIVRYNLEKKRYYVLICPECNYENQRSQKKDKDGIWVMCKKCGASLEFSKKESRSETVEVIKRRTLKDPLTEPIVLWKEFIERHGADIPSNAWFFPKFQFFKNAFVWDDRKPLSVQWLDMMLQRLDPTLTSHMARYGHTEVLLKARTKAGSPRYSIQTITQRGDWESYRMPMIYAKRKSLTPEEIELEEDLETYKISEENEEANEFETAKFWKN